MMTRTTIVVVFLCLCCVPANADSDTLLPLTFKSFPMDFQRALAQATVHEGVRLEKCLAGDTEKRSVCMFTVGSFLMITATSEKGRPDIASLILMCRGSDPTGTVKCLLAFAAAIGLTAPDLPKDARGKIISTLMDGIGIGQSASITTEERKYILQKSAGVWLYIIAADSDETGD
jgi:hypothetical protein